MKNHLSSEARYGAQLATIAKTFRHIAFEIDQTPDAIMQHINLLPMNLLVELSQLSCRERIKLYEALSYGDAGVFLACPGPSLAGVLIQMIGDKAQREIFYQHVFDHSARTFFAITERQCGSNINLLTTSLKKIPDSPAQYMLAGEKYLVGHAASGTIGVVLARTGTGPLGVAAIMLTPEILNEAAVCRETLPMIGLKGARLGSVRFDNVLIEQENILGQHQSVMQRGIMALIKTFNQMRPCIGAMAIGVAQAILDYIYDYKNTFSIQEAEAYHDLEATVEAVRELLYQTAEYIENNPLDSAPSSLVKAKAIEVAERVTRQSFEFFGDCSMVEHPWLAKWHCDILGFEYMEGTTHIHYKNIYYGYNALNPYLCPKIDDYL